MIEHTELKFFPITFVDFGIYIKPKEL